MSKPRETKQPSWEVNSAVNLHFANNRSLLSTGRDSSTGSLVNTRLPQNMMNEIAANSLPSIEPTNSPENPDALLITSKKFLVEKMTKLDLEHKFDESSLVKI